MVYYLSYYDSEDIENLGAVLRPGRRHIGKKQTASEETFHLFSEQNASCRVRVPAQTGGRQIPQRNAKCFATWKKTSELWSCNH